ncbi:hypothetical protein C0Q70_18538 [Pomacea canaliculata]|uniref:Geranylgeranyl transferase type-2 subunit alpha n=1 Tax=Pomacea canaliculata TaxID=400727 RepID=A0A2T7NGT1_POMCA|nr:hypothetical protein C0Q70_18538 [Pomacea canaliculata]
MHRHGRLKVKTTEEQQQAKQAERAKKLQLYNAATSRAFQKINPDFYTFWNIRKEIFLHMKTTLSKEELQKIFHGELEFLEMCLKVNPKSYGTWHHRRFVMDHMPQASWTRELQLCTLFYSMMNGILQMKYQVLQQLAVSDALHARFNTKENAFTNMMSCQYFVSARPGTQNQKINYLLVSRKLSQVLVSFTRSCQVGHLEQEVLSGRELEVTVELQGKEGQILCERSVSLTTDSDESSSQWSTADLAVFFRQQLSSADQATLVHELDDIMELQKMETSNKWAMLTVVLLMMAVDSSCYQKQILELLQELKSLDSMRYTYYCDLRSRFLVECSIKALDSSRALNLSGRGLTYLAHPQLLPLICELDLSGNQLTETLHFSFFQRLQVLNLANNELKNCQGICHLPCLQTLDLSVDCIKSLQTCCQLQHLNVTGNPLCQEPCTLDRLQELLPGVQVRVS